MHEPQTSMRVEQRPAPRQLLATASRLGSAWLLATAFGCTGSIDGETPPPETLTTNGGPNMEPDGSVDPNNPEDPDNVPVPDPDDPTQPSQLADVPLGMEAVTALCAQQADRLHVGRTLLRRMTRKQFNNTVRDLIGVSGDSAALISPDGRIGPFESNASVPISEVVVQQHAEAATALAAAAVSNMASVSPCDLSSGGEICTSQFVGDFGMRAYRRPLEPVEADAYLALYKEASGVGGPSEGFKLVVETMLQSPFFLYHVDVGTTGVPSATPVPLNGYELASRLAYFLWNTMPDDQLLALASTGELLDAAVLEAQVGRMLADSRMADSIPEFHLQWLGVGNMDEVVKDQTLYPGFDEAMVEAMIAETAAFSSHVIRDGDGLMSSLFTANYSVIDGPLFELYGVTRPSGFLPGQVIALDGAQRSGLLTQAAFLATHAHRNQTSPVHRGIAVRENLLCQMLDPPPANVNNVPPEPDPATTTRQRFAQHNSNPSCANCHKLIDPIGLGFENYDPIGAYRTEDGPSEVDATGEIIEAGADVEGPFVGAIELSQKLGNSQAVADCMTNQWFRFALGRIEAKDDACALQAIYQGFADSNRNVRTLISQLVLSDAFRHVQLEPSQEGP